MTDEIRRIDLGGGARTDLATKADLERLGAELKAAIADSRRRTLTAVTGPMTLYCSFCGKSQHEVKKLIAGPLVFICDECAKLCAEIAQRPQ